MVCLNRETFVTLAIVVALAAIFYLYKELKQTNQSVSHLVSQSLSSQSVSISRAPPIDNNTNKQRKKIVVIKEEPGVVVEDLSE